jgi:hypothetical protein
MEPMPRLAQALGMPPEDLWMGIALDPARDS